MTKTTELEYRNYYVERLYMTANVETGVLVNRSGRRMIALTNDFLLGLHRAVKKECGDRVEQVLYHCGRKWGRNFGKGLDDAWSEFYEMPLKDFPLAFFQSLIGQEFGYNGWGLLSVDYTHFTKGVIDLSLEGAIMADITEEKITYPADILTAGILAGMFSHFIARDIDCFQSQCAKDGFSASRFLLSDPKRIESLRAWKTSPKSHAETLKHLLTLQS
jgi:predicted hydrocarbon binding protein